MLTKRYWIGVLNPETNGGYGFEIEATSVEQARALAETRVEPPCVVNGVGEPGTRPTGGRTWLWSRGVRRRG